MGNTSDIKPSVSFTPEQKNAIYARGGTVLVSAAAGSGKTAVLVERVIQRILDPVQPVDADRLLVATFSNAAAQEMKSRITARLEALSRDNPQDLRLSRQMVLVEQASISTIHSFCLELIRQNFQQLDLPPDFRIADEQETLLMRRETVEEIIEEAYRQEEQPFLELVELLSGGRDDRNLFETVLKLYEFLRSHAFYHQWLERQLERYDPDIPVSESHWAQILFEDAERNLRYALTRTEKAISLAQADEKMWAAYGAALEEDETFLRGLLVMLADPDWDHVYHALWSYRFSAFKQLRKYEDIERKDLVNDCRKAVKDTVSDLRERFCTDSVGFREDIADLRPKIECLFRLTTEFDARYSQRKRERRAVDFSDLEHFALELLYDEQPDGRHVPSSLACELMQRYEEILVDEYQDTNEAQDAIFSALSRDEKNRFMVGDVKQSIYGFRQAMPELFLRKSSEYTDYDGTHFPAKIILGQNFRSRAAVTDGINAIFSRLMRRETCGIEYDEEQSLVAGAAYPELPGVLPELAVLDMSEIRGSKDEAEAAYVAARIAKLLKSRELVSDHGELRPVRPSDICILLRSPRNRAEIYLQALEREGVQGWSDSESGFLTTREVSVTLSVLRAVDNPLLDLPMAAALLSPICGFTADELTTLRLSAPKKPLYLAMTERVATNTGTEKEADALALFSRLRQESSALSACKVLQLLYDLTDYPAMVQVMRDGETRRANLMLLLEYARQYEKAGYRGLGGFLRFLDTAMEQDSDLKPAVTISEQADVVRIMSIHRSKGLEFPVVFLSGLSNHFNLSDANSATLLHSAAGFACKRKDFSGISWFSTVPREALRLEIGRTMREEELRILYVALTRARERLIMTVAENQPDKVLSAARSDSDSHEELMHAITRGNSLGRWLLLALARHPDMVPLYDQLTLPAGEQEGTPGQFIVSLNVCRDAEAVKRSEAAEKTAAADISLLNMLYQRADYRYPYRSAAETPSKLAASQVAKQLQEKENGRFSARPRFLEDEGLTPSERGQALHKFMQFCDYAAAADDLPKEIRRMVDAAYLTRAEGESIPVHRVERFFCSELARRIFRAEKVHRELRFLAVLGEKELSRWRDDIHGEDTTTVQGVADCVFVEDGQAVIVDYKTDWVESREELIDRYRPQLELYRMILEKSMGLKVKECVIYSFGLGKEIVI